MSDIKISEGNLHKILNDINEQKKKIIAINELQEKNCSDLSKEKEELKKCEQSICNNLYFIIETTAETREGFANKIKMKNEEILHMKQEIEEYKERILDFENLIRNEEERKRHLAVIIHFNKTNIEYIYNLSNSILSAKYQTHNKGHRENTIKECNLFIDSYNENYENLIKTAEAELTIISSFN